MIRGLRVTVLACLFLFVAARAIDVPFTYDEAASYIRYVDTSVPSVFDTTPLSVFNFEVATNHFLNTVLTKFASLFAGRSEFALRLPNLLGYVFYLGFAVLILRRLFNPLIALGGLLLLNLNPYVLDFFALGRGYGLSLGLLMGALFFLLRFLEPRTAGRINIGDLSRALAFACAAVMANFALLNVYVSTVVVLLIAAAFLDATPGGSLRQSRDHDSPLSRAFVWLTLAAVIFIPLVLSQDVALSGTPYEPVVVRLNGLDQSDLDRANVVRSDIRGREYPLRRNPGSPEWSLSGRHHYRGLRIELPRDLSNALTRIDAVIGTRAFSFDPRVTALWTKRDVGDVRLFESTPALSAPRSRIPTFRSVINWGGDRVYAVRLALASACALGILAAFALSLHVAGRVAVRANLVTLPEWRVLSLSALWVATLAGTPLYLLRRNAELYFGGTHGLVADTFTSLIDNSFYGAHYRAAQIPIVFTCIAAILAIFCVLVARAYQRDRLSSLLCPMVLLTLLIVTSTSLVAQHVIFHTVYLAGRTALFYIPLSTLFMVFVCDRLAETGRPGKAVSISIVTAAVTLAAFHFVRTANLKYVYDWKDDASSRAMIDDVVGFVERGSSSAMTVGVDSAYAPVAVYYARRSAAAIDVVVVPTTRTIDFQYSEQRNLPSGDIIGRYPFTRTALVRIQH